MNKTETALEQLAEAMVEEIVDSFLTKLEAKLAVKFSKAVELLAKQEAADDSLRYYPQTQEPADAEEPEPEELAKDALDPETEEAPVFRQHDMAETKKTTGKKRGRPRKAQLPEGFHFRTTSLYEK